MVVTDPNRWIRKRTAGVISDIPHLYPALGHVYVDLDDFSLSCSVSCAYGKSDAMEGMCIKEGGSWSNGSPHLKHPRPTS